MRRHSTVVFAVLAALMLGTAPAAPYRTLYEHLGWEAAFWPESLPVTPENYSKIELDNILRSPAKYDALVFSPFMGFGMPAAKLASGDFLTAQPEKDDPYFKGYHWRNGLPALCAAGTDGIKETIKWCRSHQMGAIVALPLNFQQMHEKKPSQEDPVNTWRTYLYPPFKQQHPECVIDLSRAPKDYGPHNAYLACDYDQAAVVAKFSAIAKEITEKYDMDGVMIDFMLTKPIIFGSVVRDRQPADAKQRAKLTAMIDAVKTAVDAASARLGRKVTFAVRVPDSAGYCQDIGIDLTAWLDAKKFDYIVFGGRFQLNPCQKTADLMAKYPGVPYYFSFDNPEVWVPDDSGWSHDDEQLPRMRDPACHAARMAEAIAAKASGVMYHGLGHWEGDNYLASSFLTFDPAANRLAKKRYFVTYTEVNNAAYFSEGGKGHITRENLLPNHAQEIGKNTGKFHIEVFDDFAALKKDGHAPKVTLITQLSIPSGVTSIVTLNGKELGTPYRKRSGYQYYELPYGLVKKGANEISVKTKGANRRKIVPKIGCLAIEVDFGGKEASK